MEDKVEFEIELDDDVYQKILKMVATDDRFSTVDECIEYILKQVYEEEKNV